MVPVINYMKPGAGDVQNVLLSAGLPVKSVTIVDDTVRIDTTRDLTPAEKATTETKIKDEFGWKPRPTVI